MMTQPQKPSPRYKPYFASPADPKFFAPFQPRFDHLLFYEGLGVTFAMINCQNPLVGMGFEEGFKARLFRELLKGNDAVTNLFQSKYV